MTYDNNFFSNGIEDLPPSGIDAVSRSRITGYTPTEPDIQRFAQLISTVATMGKPILKMLWIR